MKTKTCTEVPRGFNVPSSDSLERVERETKRKGKETRIRNILSWLVVADGW